MKKIAEESEKVALAAAKDSAAMRVIAIATIFFLPPTFVAVSILCLPMNDIVDKLAY